MNLLNDSDSDDGNASGNYHRHRRSISVGDVQAHMNYMAGIPPIYGAPPVYGGSLGAYGNMVQPMASAYYNAPMMPPPMLEAAYYNQAMTAPMYCNYGAPSVYGMGGPMGNSAETKVDEAEVQRERKEKALQILFKGFVIFLNVFLVVSCPLIIE